MGYQHGNREICVNIFFKSKNIAIINILCTMYEARLFSNKYEEKHTNSKRK